MTDQPKELKLPFAFRSFLNKTLLSFGVHEVQARQAAFAGGGGFDLTSWKPKKTKAYSYPRPAEPVLVVVHVTDVAGGFGVSKSRVRFFENGLAEGMKAGTVPGRIIEQVLRLPKDDLHAAARRLALWERYRNLPYHQIGAANGDNIVNHDLMRYSWHGNGGNKRGAGWALDCGHAQELDPWMVQTGRVSLRCLLERMERRSAVDPIVVVPHRVFSSGRRVDTNARSNARGVWLNVVLPVVEEFEDVAIGYGRWSKQGRPVPIDWDDDALYDWKGREL